MTRRTARRSVTRLPGTGTASRDSLACEEPLEIRIDGEPFTVTMRTPGDDIDLVLGFLVSEGIIRHREDVRTAAYCAGATVEGANTYNVIDVALDADVRTPRPTRNVLTTSACGLCGRSSIDDVRTTAPYDLTTDTVHWDPGRLLGLPATLRSAQAVFEQTGGIHAAGLFAAGTSDPLVVREDVGRHNAVDKAIGWALREDALPLRGTVLLVSGRASFELVQKAIVAGIPMLAAVSAPSSLAVDLALEAGLTLIGFLRADTMNVYSGGQRLNLAT